MLCFQLHAATFIVFVGYVVGHERAINLLFQCILSIL
jgi:hypothetical protein